MWNGILRFLFMNVIGIGMDGLPNLIKWPLFVWTDKTAGVLKVSVLYEWSDPRKKMPHVVMESAFSIYKSRTGKFKIYSVFLCTTHTYYPTCISKRFQDRSIWAATEEFAFRDFYESPQRKKEGRNPSQLHEITKMQLIYIKHHTGVWNRYNWKKCDLRKPFCEKKI